MSLEKCLVLLSFAILASAANLKVPHIEVPVPPPLIEMSIRHELWMAEHGRVYKDDFENELRFKIFKQNVEYIESFNKRGDRKFKLGLNKFVDLTNEEFKASYNGFVLNRSHAINMKAVDVTHANLTDVPARKDWRAEGAVTAVKDQGDCGCCWAFSAVAAIESLDYLVSGTLTSLSEQQLVDCDAIDVNRGCRGGLMGEAFRYVMNNGGLTTEDVYPYKQTDDNTCSLPTPLVTIGNYEILPPNSESALLVAVSKQPVAVAIDGSDDEFRFYSGSGVFTGSCGTSTQHAVTVIGYGVEDDGTKYWLVKNSWGTKWGDNGFGKIQRDGGEPEGKCGIAKYATYPVV